MKQSYMLALDRIHCYVQKQQCTQKIILVYEEKLTQFCSKHYAYATE